MGNVDIDEQIATDVSEEDLFLQLAIQGDNELLFLDTYLTETFRISR